MNGKASNKTNILLGVHLKVDEGVYGGVGHRQPEEGKEDMLGARVPSRALVKHTCVIGLRASL